MTNLSDFLKVKKVRCVKAYDDCLKIGKEYDVVDISVEIKVKDDEGNFLYWKFDHFEPVLADNGVNTQDIGTDILDTNADIKDTPKFKVGDRHSRAKEIKDEIIGRTYKSKNFGLFTVTDYQNSKNVFILRCRKTTDFRRWI